MAKLTQKEIDTVKALIEKANGSVPEVVQNEDLGRPVIVCNEARGVYFGYAKDTTTENIKLKKARNILYWVSANKGIFGLASTGPEKRSKVGPEADIEVRKVTTVIEVTPEAVKVWDNTKWGV